MPILSASQALVAQDIILDGRLALYHRRQCWLAVADLHFGYEITQRAAGRLLPFWGMESSEKRLLELVTQYKPSHLLLVGDLVHDQVAGESLRGLINRLADLCEPILIAGNHDRRLPKTFDFVTAWETDGFRFHHGHCAAGVDARIQIIGHHHPAGTVTDGAGLRLKLPAFIQTEKCWILPAFSPWAAGAVWPADASTQVWLCSPQRVLRLPQPTPVASA